MKPDICWKCTSDGSKAEQIAEEIDGYYKPPQIDKMIDSNINKIESSVFKALERFMKVSIAFQ